MDQAPAHLMALISQRDTGPAVRILLRMAIVEEEIARAQAQHLDKARMLHPAVRDRFTSLSQASKSAP